VVQGADTFVFGSLSDHDIVLDFNPYAGDRIDILGQGYFVTVTEPGDVLMQLSGGGSIIFDNRVIEEFNSGWFV
jgi:hypothetical protein